MNESEQKKPNPSPAYDKDEIANHLKELIEELWPSPKKADDNGTTDK